MAKKRKDVVQVSMDDAEDGRMGVCVECGEIIEGFEPDARECECECCGAKKGVYGVEWALMEGLVMLVVDPEDELGEDDDDDSDE